MIVEHEIRTRVRYADTDTMGVVYYANFLVWFESGRVELLRSRGVVYRDIELLGIFIPVIEVQASYLAPGRFDDELVVKTKLTGIGRTSMRFENEIFKLPKMELLCKGYTVHVVVGKDGRPIPVPDDIRAKLSS